MSDSWDKTLYNKITCKNQGEPNYTLSEIKSVSVLTKIKSSNFCLLK